MKILLFGVSNVGKSTVGEMLAERIGFHYYDLDDEVKRHLGITLEQFLNTGNLKERDQIRGSIINHILQLNENIVFAITPISYPDPIREQIHSEDNLLIECVPVRHFPAVGKAHHQDRQSRLAEKHLSDVFLRYIDLWGYKIGYL